MSDLKDLLLAARNVFSNCEVLGGWGSSVVWVRVGTRSVRARAGNNVNTGAVTVIQDTSGQYWAFNPNPNRVASVDRSRFLAVRPRPIEEETVTYPLLFLFSFGENIFFGGDAPKRIIPTAIPSLFSGLIYSENRFTINGNYYYTAIDSYAAIAGINPDYFDYFYLHVAPIGSVWIGSQRLDETGTTDPITGEVDITTPWECYFIEDNILSVTTGSVHTVTENNYDPATGTLPPGSIFFSSETSTGSIDVKLMIDRTETNSGNYVYNLETDFFVYGIQTVTSSTEFWDTLLVDSTKQRGFICHYTTSLYRYIETRDGSIVADTETLDTTQEVFLLDNGVEKPCNAESVFLSDALNNAARTALEAESIGSIDLTLSIPISTSINGIPDSFLPANILGRSVIFAFRVSADYSDFRVRRAYGEITGSVSSIISSGIQYSQITAHFTLLEDVAFDSRTEPGNGTLYSESKSILNLFMRGTNFLVFQDWLDLSDLAKTLAWRISETPFLAASQGASINAGCLTWGADNTIYAPNISPFAGILNENYIEILTIEEEGGVIQLNRSRSPLTVSQVPYADDLSSIPFEVTAIKVNL